MVSAASSKSLRPLKGNAVKHFCEAFLVMKWWSDCLHSTRVAKKNVREAGTLRLRPGWADTTSAGAVRPRNSADDSQRPGGPPHKKGEASQLVSAFQAFDSTQRFFPGPYSPGKGCVGLPGLNRNLTRFDFTAFFACQNASQRCQSGEKVADRPHEGASTVPDFYSGRESPPSITSHPPLSLMAWTQGERGMSIH